MCWGEAEETMNGKFNLSALVFNRKDAEKRVDAGPQAEVSEQCLKLGTCCCSRVFVAKKRVADDLGLTGSWGKVWFPVKQIVLGPNSAPHVLKLLTQNQRRRALLLVFFSVSLLSLSDFFLSCFPVPV